jgi:O-antigen/teichoic acid export membrane protein
MILKMKTLMFEDGMKARAIRGTALSIFGFGSAQFIRLASNLILTRLLFPEAFGLMALVQVVVIGLENFSDMGIHPLILQSKNGEKTAFLNTAWTIQIIRGVFLWILACLITAPVANFYGQAELLTILPVLALTTVLSGFRSTKYSLASRHLILGRITMLELMGQVIGTTIMILIAWWLRSVWALVIGSLIGVFFNVMLTHLLLPGPRNRLCWDKPTAWEVFHFGKFIFVSTVAGYLLQQGDRLVLGKYVSLEELAIFTIAYMFGSLSLMLNAQVNARVMLALYKQRPPLDSDSNFRQIGRARFLLISAFIGFAALIAFVGEPLIKLLYDPRYYGAGPMLVLLSLSFIPTLIFDGYKNILLANGNSRDFTTFTVLAAFLRIILLVVLIRELSILGAILAPFAVELLLYPLLVYFVRPYRGWYPWQDMLFLTIGVVIITVVLWSNAVVLSLLAEVLGHLVGIST